MSSNTSSRDLVRHLSRFDLSESHVMALSLREARRSMIPFRVEQGFAPIAVSPAAFLTAPDENLKLSHSATDRVAGYGLSLAPADASGWNVCRYATAGCRSACLATSGNGRYDSSTRGRIWKTRWLAGDPRAFLRYLAASIDSIPVDEWARAGWQVSLRFNVLSDLPYETIAPWIVERARARGIALYDYTKWPTAKRPGAIGYELCQSIHEKSRATDIRNAPHPVVVVDVKRGGKLPETFYGRPVIDGDLSDARFMDPAGSVVLLRYKEVQTTNRVNAVASGFVRKVA